MKKARKIGVVLALALGLILILAWLARGSGTGRNLRNYKKQLVAAGEKMTLSELAPGRAAASTNGPDFSRVLSNAVQILNDSHFWPGAFDHSEFAAGKTVVSWKRPHLPYSGTPAPAWSDMAEVFTDVGPTLRDLREALREPPEDAGPPAGVFTIRNGNFVAIRNAAQWLACAVINELHQGHLEESLENLEALYQVAQINRAELTLVSQMIRVAVTGLGMSCTWAALQAEGWNEAQLARLQRALENLDLLKAVETGYLGERAHGEELFDLMRGPNAVRKAGALFPPFGNLNAPLKARASSMFDEYVFLPIYKMTSIDSDELFYLKAMQEALTTVRQLQAGQPWGQVKHISEGTLAQIAMVSKRKFNFAHMLSAMAIPNYGQAAITALRNEAVRRMTITAIALERFKLKHGVYPQDLQKLMPDLCPNVPVDPMSGKPFLYRLKPDGKFLLYSVGEDGVDDGGDPTWTGSSRATIWEARDAVWPEPNEKE